MKLSEKLKEDHASGDFGEALEGYSERAVALEKSIEILEKRLEQAIDLMDTSQIAKIIAKWSVKGK